MPEKWPHIPEHVVIQWRLYEMKCLSNEYELENKYWKTE